MKHPGRAPAAAAFLAFAMFAVFATFALLATETPAPAPVGPLDYRFDEVKGKVLLAPGGDEKREARVAAGDPARGGDVVTTGFWWASTVVSVPERKARFEISSSSRARLQGDEPGVLLVLEKGKLKAAFDALTSGPPVERRVAAPGALLAVRGTRYGLDAGSDGTTLLVVFEGTVEVIPTVAGAPPIRVNADHFCTFGPKAPPSPPGPMGPAGMSERSWGRQKAQGPGPGSDGRSAAPGMQGPPQGGRSGSGMQQPGGPASGGGSPMGPPKRP